MKKVQSINKQIEKHIKLATMLPVLFQGVLAHCTHTLIIKLVLIIISTTSTNNNDNKSNNYALQINTKWEHY